MIISRPRLSCHAFLRRAVSLLLLRCGHDCAFAHPPPPSTNKARHKKSVASEWMSRLGGGSEDTEGHNRPMQEQPHSTPVKELLETPTWDVFYKEYIQTNTPCVFRGHTARTQPAYKKWTDEYLVKNWAKMPVTAEVWKNEARDGPREELSLQKFVKNIYKKEHEKEYYAVIPFDEDETAKNDFFLPEPVRCTEILPQSLTLWMSNGGTTSVLHYDDGENFLMLLDGTKEVMLVHQDEAQNLYAPAAKHPGTSAVHQDSVDHALFPNFQHVQWQKAVLQAGDTLYIPHSYWHQVNSQGRNLAANFWWGHKKDYGWWNPNNRSEYNVLRFGAAGAIPFDTLKSRGPKMLPCTPLPEGQTMQNMQFVDEGQYKEDLSRKHLKLLAKRKRKASNEDL